MGLQILGSYTGGLVLMYKANVILRGLQFKKSQPCWIKKETIEKWALEGKINANHVFLEHME